MRDLGPIDHFRAGAVGEPGRRTFLLEVGTLAGTEWFVLEKEQVAALARRSLELVRFFHPQFRPYGQTTVRDHRTCALVLIEDFDLYTRVLQIAGHELQFQQAR